MPTYQSRDFYFDTVQRLVERGVIARDDRVLVTCGGTFDRDTLLRAGFRAATISNVDTRTPADAYAPYVWAEQDAEKLAFGDGSFDFVIAHSGLHHCRSPHRALLEMYRVARKGLLVFEPRDGLLLRAGVKLGLGQEYELAAVLANESTAGGVANTALPNYVYRWTPREVEKTINSNAPEAKHHFEYFYSLRLPVSALSMQKNKMRLYLARVFGIFSRVARYVPLLANNIAFLVLKPRLPHDLQPWLRLENSQIVLNGTNVARRYVDLAPGRKERAQLPPVN